MIRPATPDDAAALQELYATMLPDDPVAEPSLFRETLAQIQHSGANIVLVYELQGAVVSTCYLNIVLNLTRGLRSYAIIENVVTHRYHRKMGYATALLHEAISRARKRGCYKVMLMTGSKRESTLRFYEKAGLLPGLKTAFLARLP